MKEGKRLNSMSGWACVLLLSFFLVDSGHSVLADSPGEVSWDLTLSSDSLFIGDPLSVTIELTHDASDSASFSITGVSASIEPFEVIRTGETKTHTAGGVRVDSLSLSLTSYETGDFTLGPIDVLIVRSGIPDTVRIEGRQVRVKSLLGPDARDIKEIKENLYHAGRSRLVWIIPALLLVALPAVIIWLRRRKRRRSTLPRHGPEIPSTPPHVLALEELRKIEKMELLTRGKVKQYYTMVSEVLRKYIAGRYGIVTLERTTAEIVIDLEHTSVSEAHRLRFSELLQSSDLVKFAKWNPDSESRDSLVPLTREIIEETKSRVYEEELTLAVR